VTDYSTSEFKKSSFVINEAALTINRISESYTKSNKSENEYKNDFRDQQKITQIDVNID